MRYLLDTNAVIVMLNVPHGLLAQRTRRENLANVGVSAIIIHELYYGAFSSARATQNVALVDALRFVVLPFEKEDARAAGQALARKLTLITHNSREFLRVTGLTTEDWET